MALPGVWSACPSDADFEGVRGGHGAFKAAAFAAFQKMICGVSYDKIRLGFEQMLGFPVARSTLCRAMQRLARRAKPTRDALVEALPRRLRR